MVSLKGIATGFAGLCVVGAVILYISGNTSQGNLLLGFGFLAFVLSILSRKRR